MLEVHLMTPNQLVYILSNGMVNITNDYESGRTENKVTVVYCKLKTPKTSKAYTYVSYICTGVFYTHIWSIFDLASQD
jgi:hypothetical protein